MTTGEEPFVTRKQLALAVLLALLSSLPGLALLYRNATTRTRPPAVAPVDRSGAEEGTRETALQGPQLRAPQAGRPLGYVPYRGPTPASLPASERAGPARERLASLNLTPPAAPTP
ncbi:MAG TPA: hypothetical protein VNO81_04255, partial [Candidatus Nitrosotenuis sp.]|nr:hypothetical protein [Candidatus Nitrosotenuis sp.]